MVYMGGELGSHKCTVHTHRKTVNRSRRRIQHTDKEVSIILILCVVLVIHIHQKSRLIYSLSELIVTKRHSLRAEMWQDMQYISFSASFSSLPVSLPNYSICHPSYFLPLKARIHTIIPSSICER